MGDVNVENTAGFYKNEDQLLFGSNSVTGPDFDIIKEHKDLYTYPIEGWYWFNSENEARDFFGLPAIDPATE